jgi:arylsulfatase A-like enzyme
MPRLVAVFCLHVLLLSTQAVERPNLLFILADDLGWSDPGCYGNPHHQTPRLDRLAQEGLRFTQAYAPAPICSASRAAILTGKTPARLHFEFVTKDKPGSQIPGQPLQTPPYPTNLPLEEVTTAEMLAQAGYLTAFFGKWHLNMHHGSYLGWSPTHGPLQQGFAEGDADFGGHPYAYFKDGGRSDLDLREGEFPPDSLTDKVIAFLRRKQERPFFLQWSLYHVHDPIHTRCRWLFEKYRAVLPAAIPDERVAYAAMVETLDYELGRVLDVLDATGQAQSTLIVFMSDNGGHPDYTGNAPHRGSKWNLYEGGIRVPMVARWPGRVRAGGVCDQPVHGCDVLPTFAELAGVKPGSVDGISLVPLLRDRDHPLPERPLLWHFPYYHPEKGFKKAPSRIGMNDFATSQTRPHSALRLGRHKLLHFAEDDRTELYDLSTDPGETRDLAGANPERAGQLRRQLAALLMEGAARQARPAPTLEKP